MSLKIVTIGDKTTTGGVIVNGASTVYAEGRLVALIGSEATCPACKKGIGPIRQTHPNTIEVEGRQVCLDGCIVECGCPLGANKVIASTSMEFIGFKGGSVSSTISFAPSSAAEPGLFGQAVVSSSIMSFPSDICPAENSELEFGVFLWIETVDAGHAFISIHRYSKPTAFTYGRFGERGMVPTVGEGVMIRLTDNSAVKYYQHELHRMGARVFKIFDANRETTEHYLNTVYLSGSRSPKSNKQDSARYGRVIDTYDLTGNNCTTHSVKAIQASGSRILKVKVPILDLEYTEDFTIPASLKRHMQEVSSTMEMLTIDMTDEFKAWYPNPSNMTLAENSRSGFVLEASADSAGVAGSSTGYSGGTIGGSSGGLYEPAEN